MTEAPKRQRKQKVPGGGSSFVKFNIQDTGHIEKLLSALVTHGGYGSQYGDKLHSRKVALAALLENGVHLQSRNVEDTVDTLFAQKKHREEVSIRQTGNPAVLATPEIDTLLNLLGAKKQTKEKVTEAAISRTAKVKTEAEKKMLTKMGLDARTRSLVGRKAFNQATASASSSSSSSPSKRLSESESSPSSTPIDKKKKKKKQKTSRSVAPFSLGCFLFSFVMICYLVYNVATLFLQPHPLRMPPRS